MCTGSSNNDVNFMIKDFINLKRNDIEMKEVFKFLEYSSEEIPKI